MPSTLTPGLLADELIGVVDIVRTAVHDALGTRPYTVHTVLRTWSGTRPGDGTVIEVETELVPPPSVPNLGSHPFAWKLVWRTFVRSGVRPVNGSSDP